ncbi:hypothetical protein DL96DRAFT_1608970 [Flagelloscypha sp. PMI_526]|nr:hypothetical protein DL96DRAFT_1608970 [Flagelloscypha sp. PMI_526]
MDNVRRAERKQKVTDSRMSRGLVACAECKRMKLKCDKKVPCSSCVRRECASICPTGTFASRRQSRVIFARGGLMRRVQDQIAQLRERHSLLENALAFAHSYISKDVHPLLAKAPSAGSQSDSEVDKLTEVLGTLAVGEAGEARYFGASAIIEPLYQAAGAIIKPTSSLSLPALQAHPGSMAENLSIQQSLGATLSMETFISVILNNLPERKQAWSLCKNFYEHYTIYIKPIPEEELFQVYLSPIYKCFEASHTDPSLPLLSMPFRPHRCAIIFFFFAIGTWLDLAKANYWEEADRFFQIGFSCLSMQSVFYSPEVATVQSLILLNIYNELRGAASTTTLSPTWTIISLACKISQGLGLHRDPAQWTTDELTIQRRRWLYWELVSIESLHSLGTGRPLCSRQSYVDTVLPDDVGQKDVRGQPLQGFFRCKHEAVRDCYLNVVETLLAATPPKYETIIELDRKVREKEIPAHLNRILIEPRHGSSHESNLTAPQFTHTCMLGVVRSAVLLSIHRTHLTKALQDASGNPLKSRYAPSFLASYRAASWIIKSFHAAQKQFPVLFPRFWHPWTSVLTAVMVLGSIAIHAPSSLIGSGPLEELKIASSMFKEAAEGTVSHRIKNGDRIVRKILNRAEQAHARALLSVGGAGVVEPDISIPLTDYGDDELAIFGGKTRLLTIPSRQPSHQPTQDPSSYSSSSPGLLEVVHPSLVEFLASAPMTPVASATTFQEMEESDFGLPRVSHFGSPHFMPPQLDSWTYHAVKPPQNQHQFDTISDFSTSRLQIPDRFENYLSELPQHISPDFEPDTPTPWQDFMREHSLTE